MVLCINMVHLVPRSGAVDFYSSAPYSLSVLTFCLYSSPTRASTVSGTLVAKTDSKNLLFHANVTGKHHEETVDRTGRGR
ncbi:hypothetical protein KJJ93_26715, partial [Escherichia coli]|uniref:hypothetical protein n=1 Tax=Escherichia coli TaxID=562 RepID=UPI001BD9C154